MPIVFFTLYFYCAHYDPEPEEEADWALQASAVHQSLFFLLSHMHDPAPVLVAQLHTPVTIRLQMHKGCVQTDRSLSPNDIRQEAGYYLRSVTGQSHELTHRDKHTRT